MGSTRALSLCAALVALPLTTACGQQEPPAPTTRPAFVGPSATPGSEIAPIEPKSTEFRPPPAPARRTASRFATAFLTYDTRAEKVRDFLAAVRPFTTRPTLEALGHSPRARLPWRVMRSRRERVSLVISGTSVTTIGTGMTLLVNGVTTTHTDLAVLRRPVQLRLQIANTRDGWKVTSVRGGGS